ncbi:M48 family metallopeptidase [Dietzia sp. CH92]|uniref:M48 metallopeptidase family protein n=1 Tax=Dietzia sp. CH92 TaxID=3051823 RepID=UPI0028D827C8|nr:M48 family metallopeptidase [Dietzia sp. CH92]
MPPAPRPASRSSDPSGEGPVETPALPTDPDDPRIEIRRSRRRTRTVSARVEGETVVVLMPAGLPRAEERRLVSDMLARLARSGRRRGARSSDSDLMRRATGLSERWLDGRARPESVRWVPTMTTRWASCSPGSRQIRISEALRDVPAYVLDYVLVHELVHLVVPGGHPPEFWEVVRRYPRAERAMGYLEAYSRVLRGGAGGSGGPGAADEALPGGDAGEGLGDLVEGDDDEDGCP